MSEASLLALLTRYSQPSALARRIGSPCFFPALERLEHDGLVIRRHGAYRLTHRGRQEIQLHLALARTIFV